ncbi:diacylglycerol kinase family protein [uncultured Porphyromonas sp.]|uniref:diacylglycerol/lipid kinase family protein n=1 Tax=uncultured Porphyromonas sp. TaxID=159274 RepID=UPI00262119BB|nr:diacylglycerol kinase family protein [uncultured Porphyromonas sp.]
MKGAKRKYLTIINPHSGTSRKTNIPELAYNILSESDSELYFVYTNDQGHVAQIIDDVAGQGFDVVIGVGGDGTINEVADAVRPTSMTMGVIPMGSGNGLARSLDIPMDPEEALEVIRRGYVKRIDCCEANGVPFFVTFGVGFDAQVTASYDQKSFRGPLSYVLSTVDQFIKHKSSLYRLHLNGEVIEQKAFLVTCANADQYGNNAIIAPEAELDDGLFDVVVIRNMSLLKAPRVAINLFTKNINESASIDIYRTNHLIIEREEEGYAQVDGELLELGRRIEITIQKQQLPILVPLPKS